MFRAEILAIRAEFSATFINSSLESFLEGIFSTPSLRSREVIEYYKNLCPTDAQANRIVSGI
jgi:hypothetical protein